MKKLFTVGIILVSLLNLHAEEMKSFFDVPFGSTIEKTDEIIKDKGWNTELKDQTLICTKTDGKFAGKSVLGIRYSFKDNYFYSVQVVFDPNKKTDLSEPLFFEITDALRKKYDINYNVLKIGELITVDDNKNIDMTYYTGDVERLIISLKKINESVAAERKEDVKKQIENDI